MAESEGPDKLELVAWALDRILAHEYEYTVGPGGKLATLELGLELSPRHQPPIPEVVEEALRKTSPPEAFEALISLKGDRTPEKLEAALSLLFGPGPGARGAEELAEADWSDILRFIHRQFTEPDPAAERLVDILVKEREGFSSPSGSHFESVVDRRSPRALSEWITQVYIKEVRRLLPKIVKRASLLRLLPARFEVPEEVRRYLLEASRCFIYGQFLASLFLCRSALVSAAEDRLRARGFGCELDNLRGGKEQLRKTFELARDKHILDGVTWRQADDIRELGNDAVHGSRLPTEGECKSAFDQTRGILQHLYQ
ncbi:MAG TPA: DUF4145 domain-containing protein [Terriglobia bacterium]|nr:DUF4145 domain-containing protein [Terriglobia bacterium]